MSANICNLFYRKMLVKCVMKLSSNTNYDFIVKRGILISFSHLQQNNPGLKTYKPNNLERKFLVWTRKYKSVEEVPVFISNEEMERTRNKVRIFVANIMMIGTVVGCILMVISGKRAVERGESVAKMNLNWHKNYNEEHNMQNKTSE